MSDFNPREPIRLSDIDNLLEDSIFNSSNGAKLAEYLKKKRGGAGRVRLHNIFEQVAANMPKPTFNFDMDSSEPNPLPESPQVADQPASSQADPIATTSAAPVQNGNVPVEVMASAPNTEPPAVVNVVNLRAASPIPFGKSPSAKADLGRQALLNQYHRTNTAKCELLKQITSSTPKPDTNGTLSRISAFTTSISPIIESNASPAEASQPAVAPQPVANPIPLSSILPNESIVPATQNVLAPCSQAPPPSTPQKVVIIGTPVEPGPDAPDMIIPETPSPVKVPNESPKVAHHIQPRKLTDTFNKLHTDMANASNDNENMTSDESGPIEEEQPPVSSVSHQNGEASIMRKSILKDADASSQNRRVSLRVSFSQQLVQEREISPAPSIPEAHYSSSSDDDSSNSSDDDYQVVDEVYSDDGAECDPKEIQENYKELVGATEKQVFDIPERPPSPLINVVDEAPMRWYETTISRQQEHDRNNGGLAPPATCAKENKTNLQLTNETICETMDISNVEDSADRLVELPPPPVSFNGTAQDPHGSPERPLTPPSQFTDSAKRRFLRENEDALISRLQNELPGSQQEPSPDMDDKVSESLAEAIQSFREQPKTTAVVVEHRKTIIPTKRGRRPKPSDPATTTYFETVEKTFVKPKPPSKKSTGFKPLTTAQKRKLYASTKHPQSPEHSKGKSVEPKTVALKTFNIVLRRIEIGKYLQILSDADRATIEGIAERKAKPKPNLKNYKEISEKVRTAPAGNDQQQTSDASNRSLEGVPGAASDSNEPNFAGFSENENVHPEPPPALENVLLRVANEPTKTNAVRRKVGRPQKSKQSAKNIIKLNEQPATGESGEKSSEIRLTTSEENAQQVRISEATEPQSESEHRAEEERMISRQLLTASDTSDVQGRAQKPKNRGRKRKTPEAPELDSAELANSEAPVEPLTSTSNKTTAPESVGKANEIHTSEIPNRLESTSNSSGTAPSTLTSIEAQGSETLLTSANEVPSKAKKLPKTKQKPVAELRNPTVEVSPEINNIAIHGSTSSLTSSSGDDNASSGGKNDGGNLPLKKRTIRQASNDEPPALEPFGGDRSVETSDNEPPILVPHDPVPSTSKRSRRKKADKHAEKHTMEKSEKKAWWQSRFYRDRNDEFDKTWKPKKSQKDSYNQHIRSKNHRKGANNTDESDSEPVRRGSRQRRIAESVLQKNPHVKSVYDKPIYREMTSEEMMELQLQEQKLRRMKAAEMAASNSTVPDKRVNRKRAQQEPAEPTTSKRNRPDNEGVEGSQQQEEVPSTALATCPLPNAANVSAESAPMDRLTQEKMDTYGWIQKLMDGTLRGGARIGCSRNLMQYTLDHLVFKEHNGIQYSFYSDTHNDNYGFLRFAPSAVKKLTKTSNFLLKFLVMAGNLTFHLNGTKLSITSGDFLMLPENSKYGIENGKEVSLLFMVKMLCQPQDCTVPSHENTAV
uniref:Putative microtubule-associated protein futsch n=1 Tax=Aedes aegypti TaxID=7159 RepID=A0A0P6IU32_AEDAE